MRADRPMMTKWVFDLPVTIAPKHLVERHRDFRARAYRLLEGGIRVFDVEMDGDGRTFESFQAERAPVRVLIVNHQDRIADADAGVHYLAVRAQHPGQFDRAERLFVEFDRLGRAGT